jgi:hypothetical protein
MKRATLGKALAAVLTFAVGCNTPRARESAAMTLSEQQRSPFVVSVVPTRSHDDPLGLGIAMAKKSPGTFYVIISNVSNEPQRAFETWNSWGYQAVSFQVRSTAGQTFTISRKEQDFTRNFPSTFLIAPGEHMVYPITLDDQWNVAPPLPIADETPLAITIKAIYEVRSTPEAAKERVWAGRLESNSYHFKLRHW